MPWPGITDFSEAVQNPQLCFAGTELENGVVAVNPRGMPLVYSGAFACVYPVSVGGRTFAVRCFTREVRDQQKRYNALSDYLSHVLPPSFVQFEYVEDGISLAGISYPIVRMEWVEGEVLSSFVDARLDQADTLRRTAAQWRGGINASLRGLRIAHNDLQHGNVMVQPDGNIRLVDYDGMYLPQFHGQRSPELGHKNYQHPKRSSDDYGDYVDNFPALVVYLSLLAIASDRDLWDFHNEDNLIFTRDDYMDPSSSELFKQLKSSTDSAVVKLTEKLEECCGRTVDEVPDLETLLQDVQITQPSPLSTPAPASTPTSTSSSQHQIAQARQYSLSPSPSPAVRSMLPTSASLTIPQAPPQPSIVRTSPPPPRFPPATSRRVQQRRATTTPTAPAATKSFSYGELGLSYKIAFSLMLVGLIIIVASPCISWALGRLVSFLHGAGIPTQLTYLSTGYVIKLPTGWGDVMDFGFGIIVIGALIASSTFVIKLIRRNTTGKIGKVDKWALGAVAIGVLIAGAGAGLEVISENSLTPNFGQVPILPIVWFVGKTILFGGITAFALTGPRRRTFLLGWTSAIGWGALGARWINMLGFGLLWTGIIAAMLSAQMSELMEVASILAGAGIVLGILGLAFHCFIRKSN